MQIRLFLSYSSKDRLEVMRLAEDLSANGVSVWLDEWQIRVGDKITQKIEEGLAESDYLAVWLTRHALSSGWVDQEWRTKFDVEATERRIAVLPLLREDCEVPLLLKGKRFADFRRDYAAGLEQLLKVFEPRPLASPPRIRVDELQQNLAETLVMFNALIDVADLCGLYGVGDTTTCRMHLEIAKPLLRKIRDALRLSLACDAEWRSLLNRGLMACQQLVSSADMFLPTLADPGGWKVHLKDEIRTYQENCGYMYINGEFWRQIHRKLQQDNAVHLEFAAMLRGSRGYELLGFADRAGYESYVRPVLRDLLARQDASELAILAYLTRRRWRLSDGLKFSDKELQRCGLNKASILIVLNALLRGELISMCSGHESTTFWMSNTAIKSVRQLLRRGK